jgi:GntR family transcriptional regulator
MPTPKYRQIAEDLRGQIESGTLAPGRKLTETELRDQYEVSRNTVRDAIKWLTNLNLVESKAGQGTFVAERIVPFVTDLTADSKLPGRAGVETGQQSEQPERVKLEVSMEIANAKVSSLLGQPAESDVICRHETFSVGDIPWSLQTSYYPGEFNDRGAVELIKPRDVPGGAVDYLAEKLKLKESKIEDLITVRAPDSEEAAHFKVPESGRVQLFEIFRTARDQNGRPMRLTITVCPTDRNQFALKFDTLASANLGESGIKD